MEKFIESDIVVVPFPFSDLKTFKKRPALVLSSLDAEDIIILQITSQNRLDKYTVTIKEKDFKEGKLDIVSFVRCDRIYTIDKNVIIYKIGSFKKTTFNVIKNKVIDIIK